MAYFHNRAVNLLNLHYIIGSIAMSGGGAFYVIWLLKGGIGPARVLLTVASVFGIRLVLRTFLLPVAIRSGLRPLVAFGMVLRGISYLFLAHVGEAGSSIAWLVIVSALADAVYWPSYHAYFATLGDADHRGQQLGAREAVTAAFSVVSPLATAWLLVAFGPNTAFYASGAVCVLAAIPLFFTPDVQVARTAPGAFRAAAPGVRLFLADGLLGSGYFVVWQLALFLSLDRNVVAYGGALAVTALAGAAGGLLLGRLIDAGQGSRAVWLAGGTLVFVILMRAGAGGHPVLAVAASALGALHGCLYVPTLGTAVYNQAKRSPCVMRFHIAAEAGWDIGVTAGLGVSALLIWLGVPVAPTILVSLLGAALSLTTLRRYYLGHALETIDAARVEA